MLTEDQRAAFDRAHALRAEADRLSADCPELGTPEGDAAYEADHAAEEADKDYERSFHPDYSAMSDAQLGDSEFWSDMRASWYEGGYDPPEISAQAEAYERIAASHRADTERALAAREAEAG